MNQVIAKSRRKYGGSEFKGIFPQNPADKTQMFPFDFLLVVLSKMRALARALISLLVSKTTGYLSISAPWDNTGVPCPVGCLAMGGQGGDGVELNISIL